MGFLQTGMVTTATRVGAPRWQPHFGPSWLPGGGVRFRIWSPSTGKAEIVFERGETRVPMKKAPGGEFWAVARARPGDRYRILLDGEGPFPDPWSRWQPDGVHGASAVLPRAGRASHRPVPRRVAQTTYELHVGTFSRRGDYAGAARRLPELATLGVDTIQVLPLAEWPGRWNWGYDGAYFHAPTRAYGRPQELRAFVKSAHETGLAVILDTVFNHLGPDGAYIHRYAPEFFTDRFETLWGGAIDYSVAAVRRTVLDSARWWIQEYGFDGLRLDATHAIFDESPTHILGDVAAAARRAYPRAYVVAEDHRNERRLVTDHRLDAVLADDFHHAVRVALTGERDGYFRHYEGALEEIGTALQDGWIHQGARRGEMGGGSPTAGLPAPHFVFCLENHDQAGNRVDGLHLAGLVSRAEYRAASVLLLTAPERVLIFQGQEVATGRPFNYFTDHHEELGRQVTAGRHREFIHFKGFRDHPELIADPQLEATFRASKHDPAEARRNAWCLRLYTALLTLRRTDPVLRRPRRESVTATVRGSVLFVERREGSRRRLLAVTFTGEKGASVPPGQILLHSEERRFGGKGVPTLESPCAVLIDPAR